jgi:hypothetical protein
MWLWIGLEDDEDLEEEELDGTSKVVNPLSALDDRFDKEREALLAHLRGEFNLYKFLLGYIA